MTKHMSLKPTLSSVPRDIAIHILHVRSFCDATYTYICMHARSGVLLSLIAAGLITGTMTLAYYYYTTTVLVVVSVVSKVTVRWNVRWNTTVRCIHLVHCIVGDIYILGTYDEGAMQAAKQELPVLYEPVSWKITNKTRRVIDAQGKKIKHMAPPQPVNFFGINSATTA